MTPALNLDNLNDITVPLTQSNSMDTPETDSKGRNINFPQQNQDVWSTDVSDLKCKLKPPKNGGTPPKIKQESTDSSSGTSAMRSPKASIKGKWRCSFCKQHFSLCEQLVEHVDAQHTKKKKSYACARCMVTFDLEEEYIIHSQQHLLDDRRELRSSSNSKSGGRRRKK